MFLLQRNTDKHFFVDAPKIVVNNSFHQYKLYFISSKYGSNRVVIHVLLLFIYQFYNSKADNFIKEIFYADKKMESFFVVYPHAFLKKAKGRL